MLGGALDRVAAGRLDAARRRDTVDEELGRTLLAVVGKHAHVDILPLGAIDVAEAPQPREAAVGRDQRVAGEAARRCDHDGLRVAEARDLADGERIVPHLARQRPRRLGKERRRVRDRRHRQRFVFAGFGGVRGFAVVANHAQHRLAVCFETRERSRAAAPSPPTCDRRPRHQRRDRAAPAEAFLRVVRQAHAHQQRAQIRVAEAERAIAVILLGDLARRHLSHRHRDFERCRPNACSVGEALRIEVSVVIEELDEVQAREIAVVRDEAFGDHGVRHRLGDVVNDGEAVGHDRGDLRSARILELRGKGRLAEFLSQTLLISGTRKADQRHELARLLIVEMKLALRILPSRGMHPGDARRHAEIGEQQLNRTQQRWRRRCKHHFLLRRFSILADTAVGGEEALEVGNLEIFRHAMDLPQVHPCESPSPV